MRIVLALTFAALVACAKKTPAPAAAKPEPPAATESAPGAPAPADETKQKSDPCDGGEKQPDK